MKILCMVITTEYRKDFIKMAELHKNFIRKEIMFSLLYSQKLLKHLNFKLKHYTNFVLEE